MTITKTEKEALAQIRTYGRAHRIHGRSAQMSDYSWWLAGKPKTRIIHSLALKGLVSINDNEAVLTKEGRAASWGSAA